MGRYRSIVLIAVPALGLLGLMTAMLLAGLQPKPLHIGAILCTDSPLENDANLVIRYWRDQSPQINGRPVVVSIRNPSMEHDALRAAYQELSDAGCSVIIGGGLSRTGVVLADASQQGDVPVVAISASSHSVSGRDDGFFRHIMDTRVMAGALAGVLGAEGYQRLLVVASASNAAFSMSLAERLKQVYPGSVAVVDDAEGIDASAWVAAHQPDAVVGVLAPAGLFQLLRGMRAADENLPVISIDWGMVMLPYYQGEQIDGLEFVVQSGPVVEPFASQLAEMRAAIQLTADFGPEHTLGSLEIVRQALAATDGTPAAVRAWLAQPRTYPHPYGEVALDAYGDALRPLLVRYRMVNGKLTVLEHLPLPTIAIDDD